MEIKAYEDFQFEDELVGIDDVSITYLQNSDCSGEDGKENVQSELVKLIEDFKKRAELCGGKS